MLDNLLKVVLDALKDSAHSLDCKLSETEVRCILYHTMERYLQNERIERAKNIDKAFNESHKYYSDKIEQLTISI